MREVYIYHDKDVKWDAMIPEGWTLKLGDSDDGRVVMHCTGPNEGPMPSVMLVEES